MEWYVIHLCAFANGNERHHTRLTTNPGLGKLPMPHRIAFGRLRALCAAPVCDHGAFKCQWPLDAHATGKPSSPVHINLTVFLLGRV